MSNLDSLVNQFYGLDATPAGKQNAEAAIPADAQSNQNVRTFLDLLGAAEGADYGTIVGGGRFDDFSRHPGVVGLRTAEGPSTAAGKYQITKTTYSDFAPKVGVSDFSPESQDRLALAIIEREGALGDVLAGDFDTAIKKLGNRWASLPSSPYSQPKRDQAFVDRFVSARQPEAPVRRRLEEAADTFLSTSRGTMEQAARDQESVIDRGRSLGEVVADTGLAVAGGFGGLGELIGTGVGLATGDMDNALRSGGAELRQWAQENQSKVMQAQKAMRQLAVENSEDEAGKFFAYLSETLGSPALAIDFIAEQAPQLLVMGGTGRIVGGAAKLAGVGQAGTGTAGTAAAIGTGSSMQGLDAAGQAYDQIKALPKEVRLQNPTVRKLIAQGVPEDEAIDRVARAEAMTAGAASGGASAALNLLPGASTLERALAGGVKRGGSRTMGAVKGALGEGFTEGADEAGGVLAANYATQQFDPSQPLTAGVGEAAAAGALFAPFGGVAGAVQAGQPANVPAPIPAVPSAPPDSPLQSAVAAAAAATPASAPVTAPAADPAARLAELQAITQGTPDAPGRVLTQQEADEYRALTSQQQGIVSPEWSPASDLPGLAGPDPLAPRLAPIAAVLEDRAALSALRTDPRFGKAVVTDLLTAYARAKNPTLDRLTRDRSLSDLERLLGAFSQQPTYVPGAGDLTPTTQQMLAEQEGGELTATPEGAQAEQARRAAEALARRRAEAMANQRRAAAEYSTAFDDANDEIAQATGVEQQDDILELNRLIAEEQADLAERRGNAAEAARIRNEVRAARARNQVGKPAGSFGQMDEFAALFNAERADLEAQRAQVAQDQQRGRETAQQRFEAELAAADARVAESRARESQARRQALLTDLIDAGVPAVNPVAGLATRFTTALQQAGYRDIVPTEDEMRVIQRAVDVANARGGIEPAAPNEMPADLVPARTQAGAPAPNAGKIAEVLRLLAQGWRLQGKTLVSPRGKRRILNLKELEAVRNAQKALRAGLDPAAALSGSAAQPEAQAAPGAQGVVPAAPVVPATQEGGLTNDVPTTQQVAPEAQEAGGQEGAQEADGRVTRDRPMNDGATVVDADGNQYRVHYQRNDLVIAHPIVNGKPQVSADTTVRFWTNPDVSPSGENDRTDPIYPVEQSTQAPTAPERKPRTDDTKPAQALSDYEQSRIESAAAYTSLTPESAAQVRIERKIKAASNPADMARLQGYYDFLRGRPNAAKDQGLRLEVSYQQGWNKGKNLRENILKGRPWYETDKYRDGSAWNWAVYREGLYIAGGKAKSEKAADQAIEDARFSAMEANNDFAKKDVAPTQAPTAPEQSRPAPGQRSEPAQPNTTNPAPALASADVTLTDEGKTPIIATPLDAAAHEAATSPLNDLPQPTDEQKKAGNYVKGAVRLHGMDISIENPQGSVRSGVAPDGTAWQNTLAHHYGYIKGSIGADQDQIDVFLTSDAETATIAWVIDQKNPDGSFDEHKAVIGPKTEEEARAAYLANYDAGWDGIGAITSMPMEAFRAWALDGKRKRKALVYVEADATNVDPSAPVNEDGNWLAWLFGAQPAAPEAPAAKIDLPALSVRLRQFANEKLAEADDWASRQYKKNDKQIKLYGDGPRRNPSISVSEANESRRRRAIEDLQQQAQAASNLADRIDSGQDIQPKIEMAIRAADSDIARDGRVTRGKTRDDQIASYISGSMLGDQYGSFGDRSLSHEIYQAYKRAQTGAPAGTNAAEAVPTQGEAANAAGTPQPLTSTPFATFEQLKTALKVIGDMPAIQERLRNLGIAHVPVKNGVNVPNKLRWDEVRAAIPVRIDTYRLNGVPARLADVTLEVMASGAVVLKSQAETGSHPDAETALRRYIEGYKDAPEVADAAAEPAAPAAASAQTGDTNGDIQAQLARFEAGEYEGTPDAVYRAAAIRFLEGDLAGKPPTKNGRGVSIDGLENIAPQPVKKSVRPAKTVADKIKAVRSIGGQNDIRYYLNGVHIEPEAGRIVATDGNRLAVVEGIDMAAANLPPREKVAGSADKLLTVLGDDGKWIDGIFPPWSRVVPDGHKGQPAVFNAERTASQARGIAKAWRFSENTSYPIAPVSLWDGTVFVNAGYLADAADLFRRLGYDSFLMSVSPKNSGSVYLDSADGAVRQVIMPVRGNSSPFFAIVPDIWVDEKAQELEAIKANRARSERVERPAPQYAQGSPVDQTAAEPTEEAAVQETAAPVAQTPEPKPDQPSKFKSSIAGVRQAYGDASAFLRGRIYSVGIDNRHKARLEARLVDAGLTKREASDVIASAQTLKAQETRGAGPMTFLQLKYVLRAASSRELIEPVDANGRPAEVQQPEQPAQRYVGPADVSSRDGQMDLANRAGTIAALKAMNAQLRAIAPDEAWADANIEDAANLDALRNQISEALVRANRASEAEQSSPLRKRLEEASGEDLKTVFDALGLAGARMSHGERVEALMREDAQAVSDALDDVQKDGEPAAANAPAEPPHYADLRDRARAYWAETAVPAVREYLGAFSAFGAGRLERNRVKPEGMSAREWLESFQRKESEWRDGRKVSETGVQTLSRKDLWPTEDGSGERLRKSMLAAIKALRGAPMTTSDMLAEAFTEDGEAPVVNQSTLTGPRRNPTQVSAFAPYNAGDIVTIGGQDWQVQQDMGGWYLTSTGNWRGTHPTIQKIRGMNELIAEIEQAATAQGKAAGQTDAPTGYASAVDALNADDHEAAALIVQKMKGDELVELGRSIGFYRQNLESVKAYKDRLTSVLPQLTKTVRETTKRKRALQDKLLDRAMEYDRAANHAEAARKNGVAEDSTAFISFYRPMDGGETVEMRIPEKLDLLAADVQSLRSDPDFAEIGPMVENARPRVFNHKTSNQPAYRLTFDQWLEQQWAGNRYRDTYLENAGGDEQKARYAAASGGGESEVSARGAYWSALMNAPRDADVSLEMYDSLTDAQKRDASRHFFRLDDLVRDRYQREAMQKKSEEDRVAREVIAPMQAEVDRLRSMNERTKSGTDAWNKRATDAANLEGLIADLRAGRITAQELPAKWRGEGEQTAPEQPKPDDAPVADPAVQDGAQTPAEGVIPNQIGERLVGGRKDRAALQAMTADLTDEQIASMPLSKIWPADEIDKIEDVFVAAFSHAARAEIPAKPRSTYKIPLWVKKVKMFRQIVSDLLFRVDRAQMMQKLREAGGSLEGFASKVALLEAIDRKQWGRIGKVGEYPDATRYDESGNSQPAPFVNVEIDGSNVLFGNAGSAADVVERVIARLGGKSGDKKMAFEVRGSNGRYFINKKGDKEYRSLKTFTSAKEALAYRDSNYDELVAAWEAVKDRDNVRKSDVRRDENRDRTGKDWRSGRDATGDDFLSTFGFRGVEFGNWVNQGEGARERQGMLNQAYDALMDLADVLGIPPKAVSLNGSMGLAFGSRGSGTASAHFEPGNLVINLTKTRGAGKLAHEWFHALDNYFARQRGGEVSMQGGEDAQMVYRRNNYITYRPETYYVKGSTTIPAKDFEAAVAAGPVRTLSGSPDKERRALYLTWRMIGASTDGWVKKEGVRPEVEGRFAELVEALDASPMAQRSARNDKSATDGYWSRIIERGARAFENYVILKMRQQGYQNDYLANVRTPEEFPRSADRYPYLLDDEAAPIEEAFDNLFGTIQTRETEQGVAMFSFAAPAAPQSLAEVESSWDSQGIENALSEKDGIITLHKIIVPDGKREAGVGTKAMQELFAYADATGQQVALTPSGDFGGNKRRLESFYRGLGFRTYKGFAVREKLIRDPASPEVRYSFAGERAATADKMALGAAQERLAAGEDAETVRQETGWFRGADGKWRFEVSDGDAKLKNLRMEDGEANRATVLSEILDHPALFAAYPALRNMDVQIGIGPDRKDRGSFSEGWQGDKDYFGSPPEIIVSATTEARALSTLLHEIQHGIQTVEGFASGGNGNTVSSADMAPAFRERINAAGKALDAIDRDAQPNEWEVALKKVSKARNDGLHDAYMRLAGETEARNTEARRGMTAAERRATPPSQTADVADADVIVVFNGKEMASAPVPANALSAPTSVARPAASTLIADFLATRPGAPGITLVDRFADLPTQVQRDALDQGGSATTTKGAVFEGRVYLVRENHGSITDLEATLYHETVGHVGLRTMLGDGFTQKLNQLYLALGGQTGLVSIMTRRGMGQKARQYVLGIQQAMAADAAKKASDPAYRRRWTEAVANGVLTEEVFAHIAQQQGARPGLMDRFKALIGAVRDWLRRHKLMNLASLGETDLLYMLDKARRGLNGPGGPRGGRVPATARIDEMAGLSKENLLAVPVQSGADAEASGRSGWVRQGGTRTVLQNAAPATARIDEAASMPRDERQAYLAEAAGRGPGVIRQGITDIIAAFRSPSAKVFGPLHKSISTSLHKASISPQFAEVFQIADRYERDISRFSAEPAARAPKLIPSFDKLSDTVNRIIHGDKVGRMAPQVADAIFAGTLAGDSPTNGRVWTNAELRDRFGMNDELINLYREARAALDLSLDISGAGIAWQMVKRYIPDFKEAVRTAPVDAARTIELAMLELEAQTQDAANQVLRRMQADEAAADALRPEHARLIRAADDISKARAAAQAVAQKVAALKAGGYAPLMRFGKYNVDVTQQNEDGTEERIAFVKFETEMEAKTAEQRLRRQYPDATIARSVSSEEAWKVFQGVDPDTVALFAEHIGELEGLDVKDEVLQAWYRDAVNNRSAFKRMIHRKGTEGFDRDLTRVLASFVTSNARMAARQFNLPDMERRIAELKRTKAPGDVVDEAERLRSYIENPEEPFKGLKGWMFAWFLGGSLSSALLNATQPLMMTFPYLSQFGAGKAAAALAAAVKGGATGKVTDPELQDALLRAAEDGKVDAQQVHHLFHEGMRPLISKLPFGQNARARAQGVMTAWGYLFGAVENMNRRMSFIAAYNMAKADPKLGEPYEFAVRAVDETQGIYCVDTETEMLTAAGWKRYSELAPGEDVFSIDAQGRLVHDKLQDVHVFAGQHEATEFRNSNGLSIIVTDDHRNIIQNYNSRDKKWQNIRVVKTKDLKNNHFFLRVPLGDSTGRKAIYSDDQVRILAWVAAEGHFFAHRNVKEKRGVGLVQSKSHNPQYVAEIDDLLQRLGGHFNRKESSEKTRKDTIVCWQLRKPLWSFIHEALPGKRVTMDLVSRLTIPQISIFLDTFGKGDGSFIKNGGCVIGQKSIETLNTLQAMAVLSGKSSTLYERLRNTADGGFRDVGCVYVAKNSVRAYVKEFERKRITVETVWCPQTETGTWIARRNGRTFITGNSKSNRPNWARGVGPFGAVGVAAFTFKQYSIGYVEMMLRMAKAGPAGKRAALMQLGILVMLAGLQGIPGAEDLEDLIDTAAQYMGYTGNSRLELHRYLKRVMGEEIGNIINVGADEIANIIQHGLLSASVLRGDLSSRIGMGDLFPATAIAKPSTQSRAAELADIFGPPATMSESLMNALLAFDAGGGALGVTKALLPVALSNAWKGANMAFDGQYNDARGRKVVETDMLDAGLKFFGIQPSAVNAEQRPARLIQLSAQRLRQVKGNIHALRAQAIVEKDPEKRRRADEMLRDWNERNPDSRLSVSAPAILRRVKEMNAERRARLMKSLPKEMRQSAAEEFEQ